MSGLPGAFLHQATHCEDFGLPFMDLLLRLLAYTDIPQVERASFHLVAILGSDQPFFDQLYCGSGI